MIEPTLERSSYRNLTRKPGTFEGLRRAIAGRYPLFSVSRMKIAFPQWWQSQAAIPRVRGYVIKLSLIGMSGAGKSHWARKLAAAGFRVIGIDDRIERKLAP